MTFNKISKTELHAQWQQHEERLLLEEGARGKEFVAAGNYDAAITCFRDALQRPYLAEIPCFKKVILYNIGYALTEQGNYKEAIKTLHEARLIPDNDVDQTELNVDLLCHLGLCYFQLKDFQNALKYYKMADAFHLPDYNKSIKFKLHFLNQFDKKWLSSKIEEAENSASYEQALGFYDKYLKLTPNDYNSWNNRANILNTLQSFKEAKKSAEKAIAIDRTIPNAWRHLGNAYLGLHEHY